MNNQRQNPIQQADFSFMDSSTINITTSSFSDLLNSSIVVGDDDGGYKLFSPGNGGGGRIAEKNGSSVGGVPKFKSAPPPSLPISPPSYFAMPPGLSPSELLDSPVLLSSSDIFPSPTTGAIAAQSSIWKQQQEDHATVKQEDNNLSDFTFQTQTTPNDTTIALKAREQQQKRQQQGWGIVVHQHHQQQENKLENQSQPSQQIQPSYGREQKKSDDGYNWRKYGQKQVKGSDNPRSYYKCTFPDCPMKKKIEKSLVDGQITEIVYKGSHTHPKPANTRRSTGGGVGYLTSSAAAAAAPCQAGFQGLNYNNDNTHDQENSSFGSGQSVATPEMENSSISIADDIEADGVSDSHRRSRSAAGDEYDHVDQRDAKRWKAGREGESECMSAAAAPTGSTGSSRTVREPRVVVQTTSDIDILDDGYRWRKYGQKVVKGNPNPRSYYKCTYAGCQVRKHVERAAHDLGAVITTYEGKHNHDVPAARGGSNGSHRPPPSENNNSNGYMSGGVNMAVRPLATYEPRLSSTSQRQQQGKQYHAHQLQSSLAAPFTLEMLQSPGAALGTSVGLGNSEASYAYGNEQLPQHDPWLHYYNNNNNNNNNNTNNNMMMNNHYNDNKTTESIINSRGPKDEPVRDDAFLESLLC